MFAYGFDIFVIRFECCKVDHRRGDEQVKMGFVHRPIILQTGPLCNTFQEWNLSPYEMFQRERERGQHPERHGG